jgi:hypothetical protein
MRALQEAIQRGGDESRRSPQGGGPIVDSKITGQNDRTVTIALVNDFVKDAGEVAFGEDGVDRVVPDLVEDQKVGAAVLLQQLVKSLIGH